MRHIKFLALFIVNFTLAVLPFFWLRKCFLRALGFSVGNNVSIHRKLRLSGFHSVTIGERSTVNHSVFLDNRNEIIIGKNVTLSHGVKIYTLGHDINCPDFTAKGDSVIIQDNCVVFAGAVIMPGVRLAEYTVIYPYSLMSKSSKNKEVWGGNPANFIKHRDLEFVRYRSTYKQWLGN